MKYACILGAFLFLITGCASEVTVLGPTSGAGGAGSATSGGNGGNSTSSQATSVAAVTSSITSTASTSPSPDPTILCTEACELLEKCEVMRFAECMDGCVPDLGDCSAGQLGQIKACLDKVEQCSAVGPFFDCIDEVSCTDGDDGD